MDSQTQSSVRKSRVLLSYDDLPKGCIAFPVHDDCCEPVIHRGEFAVVDVSDREPEDGALFLRQFGSDDFPSDRMAIVEAVLHVGRSGRRWVLAAHNRPRGIDEMNAWANARRLIPFGDGPFADDGEHGWYVRDRIVGRVIGTLFRSSTLLAMPAMKPVARVSHHLAVDHPNCQRPIS